jgi:hypothetical protein
MSNACASSKYLHRKKDRKKDTPKPKKSKLRELSKLGF